LTYNEVMNESWIVHLVGQAKKAFKNLPKGTNNWREAAKEVFGDIPRTALNLRGLRNREGMTQAQLGQAIGIEQSNISKMERGKRQIGIKIAKRIGELFDIDYRLFL